MSVIVITGIQAAGKSTVAQALAEQLPRSVHLRGDQFRRMIVNGGVEMGPAEPEPEALAQLALRYRLAAAAADGYAQAGFAVVWQDIILGEHLQQAVDHLRTTPVYVVVLAPSVAAVASRDADRQAQRGKVAYRPGDAGIAALDEHLRTATPRLGLWVDTSEMDVADVLAAIETDLPAAQVR